MESVAEPKRRSAGFPVVSLRDAVDVVVAAGLRGGADHSHNAFATYLGHSTANSGPYRKKLAALRDWGLITRGGDRVTYTPLARDFIREAPDHLEQRELLRQAFMNCTPFAALYNDSAAGVGLDPSRLRAAAMIDVGVSADSADKFVDSFVESVVAAGLGEGTQNGGVILGSPVDALPVPAAPEEASQETGPPSVPEATISPRADVVVGRPVSERSPADAAVHQVWTWDTGEITFTVRSTGALPASAFTLIGEVVAKAKALACELDHHADGAAGLPAPPAGEAEHE